MKIKCESCGNYFNDSEESCPKCGTPRNSVSDNISYEPQTIEELKRWYSARKLPPPSVTRFFIGKNVQSAKAFGIYKDGETGNFIVYKNKASGERSIHYEGDDEAYAVDEIYTKLKETIVQQKQRSRAEKALSAPLKPVSLWGKITDGISSFFSTIWEYCPSIIKIPLLYGLLAFVILIVVGIFVTIFSKEPKTGYYEYDGKVYYYYYDDYGEENLNWYEYLPEEEGWSRPIMLYDMPSDLQTKKTSKKYFLGSVWNADFDCSDFNESIYYADINTGFYTDGGYYSIDDNVYFHLDGKYYENWYEYTNDWNEMNFDELPYYLQHTATVSDYFSSENYNASLNVTDFSETVMYKDFQRGYQVDRGYYSYNDNVYYHLYGLCDSGWFFYDDSDNWVEIEARELPDDLQHASKAADFYYTPEWDPSTQFSDFEDTDFYSDYMESIREDEESYDSDDSDFDWDSDDSWDSDSYDWDSDW